MVIKAEQERVRQLLSEAIPMLCKTGLSYKNQFSVEALVGITLDDQCFIVSIKESFESDLPPAAEEKSTDAESADDETTTPGGRRKRRRKRKRSSKGPDSDSESDYESHAIKTEGDENDQDGESLDAIIIKDEPEDTDVNIKFETYPAMPTGQPFQTSTFGPPVPSAAFNSQSSSFMSSPGQAGMSAALGSPVPGQVPPWAPGTPGTPGTPGADGGTISGSPNPQDYFKELENHNGRMFVCLICTKLCNDKQGMKRHIQGHFGITPAVAKRCIYCNYTTPYSTTYRRHVARCSQVNSTTVLEGNLKE